MWTIWTVALKTGYLLRRHRFSSENTLVKWRRNAWCNLSCEGCHCMSTCSRSKLEVFSEYISCTVLIVEQSGKWYHVWFHVSYLVHGLHGVWCLFQGWVLAHWVTHSVGVSSGPHSRPPRGLCYPWTHSSCSFGSVHE